MRDKELSRHFFRFNEHANGGESLSLTTIFIDNGDPVNEKCDGIFTNQKLTLQSYCNSSSFDLMGAALTPEILRKLANELESAGLHAKELKLKEAKQ